MKNKLLMFFFVIGMMSMSICKADNAINCNSRNLTEDSRCIEDYAKTLEKMFADFDAWANYINNATKAIIKESVECKAIKVMYEGGYNAVYEDYQLCNGPLKTDLLQRFAKVTRDYQTIKEMYEDLKIKYRASKSRLVLLEKSYQLIAKDYDEAKEKLHE